MTRPATDDRPDPVVTMTGFARALRASGVAADPTRLATALAALTHVDPLDARQVYWAGRVTLCAEPDDLPRYDVAVRHLVPGAPPATAGTDPAEPARRRPRAARPRPRQRRRGRGRATTRTCCAPRPATPRRCATATSPCSTTPSATRSTSSSPCWPRGWRTGAPGAPAPAAATPSTSAARSAGCSPTAARSARSRACGPGSSRAAWCCCSTSAAR